MQGNDVGNVPIESEAANSMSSPNYVRSPTSLDHPMMSEDAPPPAPATSGEESMDETGIRPRVRDLNSGPEKGRKMKKLIYCIDILLIYLLIRFLTIAVIKYF